MIFYLLTVFALAGLGAKVYPRGELSKKYLSVEKTTAVKGFFLMLVFSRHFKAYVGLYSPFDGPFQRFDLFAGQLLVCMFFFYSGYGVFRSMQKKGKRYISEFPYKRIFLTFLKFAMAVLIYAVADLFLHVKVTPKKLLLALFGYTSIGNSCWYIFAILWMYVFTWIAFRLFFKHKKFAILVTCVFIAQYIYVMMQLKSNTWWYDTVICYPLGMIYAHFKEDIEEVFRERHDLYVASLITSIAGFIIFRTMYDIFLFHELTTVFFTLMVLFITMKIDICNVILYKIGANLFIMYIMQRLPMKILNYYNVTYFEYFSLILSIFITYLIACVFRIIYKTTDVIVLKSIAKLRYKIRSLPWIRVRAVYGVVSGAKNKIGDTIDGALAKVTGLLPASEEEGPEDAVGTLVIPVYVSPYEEDELPDDDGRGTILGRTDDEDDYESYDEFDDFHGRSGDRYDSYDEENVFGTAGPEDAEDETRPAPKTTFFDNVGSNWSDFEDYDTDENEGFDEVEDDEEDGVEQDYVAEIMRLRSLLRLERSESTDSESEEDETE